MPPPDAEANPTHVMEPGGKANLNRSSLREILFHSGSLTHSIFILFNFIFFFIDFILIKSLISPDWSKLEISFHCFMEARFAR